MSVEMTLSRETLCFERLALAREEQVSVEGEATLPGSMRDAVTVLSVQAQAYLEDARAMAGGMTLRGHVSFQALYTQGDLTRIRAMETTCDFEHSIDAPELQPDMRVNASVAVQETEGTAASGRMTLRALLDLQIEAFETTRQALVTDAAGDADALRTRMQRGGSAPRLWKPPQMPPRRWARRRRWCARNSICPRGWRSATCSARRERPPWRS